MHPVLIHILIQVKKLLIVLVHPLFGLQLTKVGSVHTQIGLLTKTELEFLINVCLNLYKKPGETWLFLI